MAEDKRQSEIIRIQKKRNSFVMMDKGFLEDERLSFKAKGILAYLLSKPDNWQVIVGDLIKHSDDGKKAVYSGLNELKDYGYYKKIPIRDKTGRRIDHWESVIYECPDENVEPQDGNNNSLFTQNGEIEKKPVKSTSSLFTPFVYIDNVHKQNGEYNNNYYSNNDFNNNQSKSSQTMTTTGRDPDGEHEKKEFSPTPPPSKVSDENPKENTHDDFITYRQILQDNICYDNFILNRPMDAPMVDELLACLTDVICTHTPTVKINGEIKNREMVKSVYLKINQEDVEHILDRYREQRHKVKNIHAYLKTMLYTVRQERDHFYENRVRADGLI